MNNEIVVVNNGNVVGDIEVPGDKSISHRAIIFGSLASGVTTIHNCLLGDDVLATIKAFQELGIDICVNSKNIVAINGGSIFQFRNDCELNLGNSGTSIRLLMGLLSGIGTRARLTGDESLRKRPMKRVSEPLEKMGANIKLTNHEFAPVQLLGSSSLKAIQFKPVVASAQVKSAILLAGLFCSGETIIREKIQTRDHTERMLALFGGDIKVDEGTVCVKGQSSLISQDFTVPGDFSSAAFLIVGAIIANQGELLIRNVGLNPTRLGLIKILKEMGAKIDNQYTSDEFEPTGDIKVCHSDLDGITVDPSLIPSAIDEFPIFFIAAACSRGTTVLRGAEELRHKESDRLAVMAAGLHKMGIKLTQYEDGIEIEGGTLSGGTVDAQGDHRCAMSFIMSSLKSTHPVKILNTKQISTSFPSFLETVQGLGLNFS